MERPFLSKYDLNEARNQDTYVAIDKGYVP